MCAVTKWWILGMFAAAQMNSFTFLGCKSNRGKRGYFMRPVAERLTCASPTSTPVIRLSLFHFDRIRFFLSNFWFFHDKHLPFNINNKIQKQMNGFEILFYRTLEIQLCRISRICPVRKCGNNLMECFLSQISRHKDA